MASYRRVTRKNLPAIAAEQGVSVTSQTGKFTFKKRGIVVIMYENGCLVRGDVDLSLAKSMQVKDVVSLFGL